ncbi:hypothetical protein D3C74_233990 [compost metagenome]
MIEINDYSEVAFLNWISSQRIDIDNEYELNSIIEEFIVRRLKYWDLKFILKLFQDYSIKLDEFNVLGMFERFCSMMIDGESILSDSVSKRPSIQQYLYDFITYLKTNNEYASLNKDIVEMARQAYEDNSSLEKWLSDVMGKHRKTLIAYFSHYTEHALSSYQEHIYRQWWQRQKNNFIWDSNKVFDYSFDARRKNLKTYFENSSISNTDYFMVDYRAFNLLSKNDDGLFLDFLHFLTEKELNIDKNINVFMLNQYIDEYCNTFNLIDNKKLLLKLAKHITNRDNKFKSLVRSLAPKLSFEKRKYFNINRIYVPKMHGLLLFPRYLEFNKFLHGYWEDIHIKTGDTLDLYYSKDDLRKSQSGYKILKKLYHLEVNQIDLPALLVWRTFGSKIEVIDLDGLDYSDIFKVICFLTNIAESDSETNLNFNEWVLKTKERAVEIKENKKHKTIYEIRDSNIGSIGDNNNSINKFD